MDFLTTTEMAEVWKISSRRISLLCTQGRVEGAFKKGKTWLIPKDVKKPEDPIRNSSKIQGTSRYYCNSWYG